MADTDDLVDAFDKGSFSTEEIRARVAAVDDEETTTAEAPAPDAPPTEAEEATETYVVAFVSDPNGSVIDRVLADTDMVEDETEVWLESAPDERPTMAALADQLGEDAVEWDSEPQPYQPPQAVQASLAGEDGRAAHKSVLDEVEERIARAEGLTAGLIMDSVEDEAMKGAEGVMAHVAAVADASDEVEADAEDPEAAAESEDDDERTADLVERLDRLEETLAKLLDEQTEDFEVQEPDDGVHEVDERKLD